MASFSKAKPDLRGALLQANPVPMFLYEPRTLRILAANRAAYARYGYSPAEMHSMSIRSLRPGGSGSALDCALHLNHEAPERSLWTHVSRQGEPFAVELSVVPFVHHRRELALLCALDATAWNASLLKLVRSEHAYRSLFEHCPFGIYRLDLASQRYEQANSAFLELLGYTLDEFRSLDRPIFADSADRDRYLTELHLSGIMREADTRLRARDGRMVRASISGFLSSDPETGRPCVCVYVRDTTRQRELEEQLGMCRHLEAVGRFAGGVAHDFNNIAQSINLSCELALEASPLPVRAKLLGIMQQANRAAGITHQLLAFSRRQLLRPMALDLNDCIQQALPELIRGVGSDVCLELRLGEALPRAFVDPEQFTLVLTQLADNAHAAMLGGGTLRISTALAGPGSPLGNQPSILLTIADSGVGMDEATRQRIFEPFFSTKRTVETAGLGLATVYGIIRQSNGSIECESSPGRGATFRIYLPVAPSNPSGPVAPHTDAAVPSAAIPTASEDVPAGVRERTRILVVLDGELVDADDSAPIDRKIAEALEASGFAVDALNNALSDAVNNGRQALAAFERAPYSLVVAGLGADFEWIAHLRQLYPSVPLVLITSPCESSNAEVRLHSRLAYLQRPLADGLLVAVVRSLLPSSEPS